MDFQVRIRVDEDFSDITYIKDWLSACAKGFAFKHDKPGNHHYHIYLFGLERNPDAMRKYLRKFISDKQRYMVGTTAGKQREKITPILAYQYAMNPKSHPTRVWAKGIPLEDLQAYHENAVEYYKPVDVTVVTREEHYVVKPDRVWERLYTNAENYGDKTVKAIKSQLCAEWLNQGKAIPREADLNRYAKSLYMLNKYKKQQVGDTEIPPSAFMEEDL